jgi:hypothetical protein
VTPQGLKDEKDPNLVHNVVEKTFEGKWKKRIIGWANNQTSALALHPAPHMT